MSRCLLKTTTAEVDILLAAVSSTFWNDSLAATRYSLYVDPDGCIHDVHGYCIQLSFHQPTNLSIDRSIDLSQIMAADQKYRAACAEAARASQATSSSVGGAEERLQEELASIHAQVAAEESEVKSTESRVQR